MAPLLSCSPIDVDEIGCGVDWYFSSFVKVLHIFIQGGVRDVLVELPHVCTAEELLGAHLVHEDV